MKTFLFVLLAVAANAYYAPSQAPVISAPKVADQPALQSGYAYNYKVADDVTGDKKDAAEKSEAKKVTGEYKVEQPDGCIRHVKYVVDEKGYQPTVTYSGPCDPASYVAPVIPLEQVQVEKENLAKVAANAAVVAAEYKAEVDKHKKIADQHQKMKEEIAAAELKREAEQKKKAPVAYSAPKQSYAAETPVKSAYPPAPAKVAYETVKVPSASVGGYPAGKDDQVPVTTTSAEAKVVAEPPMRTVPATDAPKPASKPVAQPVPLYVKAQKQQDYPSRY